MGPITQIPTNRNSRFVAGYYVITIALGVFVLLFHGRLALAADLIAIVFYVAMTAVFYDVSKRMAHRQRPARRN